MWKGEESAENLPLDCEIIVKFMKNLEAGREDAAAEGEHC